MPEEKTVETGATAAVPEPKKEEITGDDMLAVLEAKDAELKKVSEERENYRKGMLKAKGKLPDEEEAEDQMEMMRRIAREEALSVRELQLNAEKDKLIKDMAFKLKETQLALKNRGQVINTASGGSTEEVVVPGDNMLSATQIKELKTRGWSDDKIAAFKANLVKNKR